MLHTLLLWVLEGTSRGKFIPKIHVYNWVLDSILESWWGVLRQRVSYACAAVHCQSCFLPPRQHLYLTQSCNSRTTGPDWKTKLWLPGCSHWTTRAEGTEVLKGCFVLWIGSSKWRAFSKAEEKGSVKPGASKGAAGVGSVYTLLPVTLIGHNRHARPHHAQRLDPSAPFHRSLFMLWKF